MKKLDLSTGKIINVRDHARVATKIRESIWLITPEGLNAVLDIANRRLSGEQFDEAYLEELAANSRSTQDGENNFEVIDGVGVLPIMGPIFGKANLMTQLSGATSLEVMQSDFRQMLDDSRIQSILLNIDSPGGTSDLVQEMGEEIFAARDVKPIYAIANTNAGSAAYWLMSQASKLYSTPSGSVGSVGAYTVHTDQSVADAQQGNKYTFIHAGAYKVEGNPHEPLSQEGLQFRQERINELYDSFVGAIADGRGVSTETVKAMYGGGRMLTPTKALNAGMIDGITSYEKLLEDIAHPSAPTYRTNKGGENVDRNQLLRFAQSLNVSVADTDTDEQIEANCFEAATELTAEVEPIRRLRAETSQTKTFKEQFPEQAARMEELEKTAREGQALTFANQYKRFWIAEVDGEGIEKRTPVEKGFSTLAQDKITAFHASLGGSPELISQFGDILNLVASGKGIVDYKNEGSSTRSADGEFENPTTNSGLNARFVFKSKMDEVAAREENKGKGFNEILTIAAKENPVEFEAYQSPIIAGKGTS